MPPLPENQPRPDLLGLPKGPGAGKANGDKPNDDDTKDSASSTDRVNTTADLAGFHVVVEDNEDVPIESSSGAWSPRSQKPWRLP